jgi:hypothetical protein
LTVELEAPDPEDDTHGIGNTPLLVSLMPHALLAVLYLGFPSYGTDAFAGPPHIVGIPLGMVSLGIGLAWGALGTYLVSESDSYAKALAVLIACTLPASLAVVLAPFLRFP